MNLKLKIILPYFGVFVLGAGLATLITAFAVRPPVIDSTAYGVPLRDADSPYDFVSPLLACNVSAQVESQELSELKTELGDIIETATNEGKVETASVYYRNLDLGTWTAINSEETFTPASLMKVPIYMTYLKQAELQPGLLTAKLKVTTDPAPNKAQDIAPEQTVEVGKTYTVEELLELMIKYSDNRATYILTDYLDSTIVEEIFSDLGVPAPTEENQENYGLDTRLYSRFFRILYNATFLSDEDSNDALRLLSQTTYTDGLVAGVPDDIKVAHKFGEASLTLEDGTKGHELHDCGIIYTEEQPYLLCIMTKGESTEELSDLIADLSRVTYEYHVEQF